MRSPAGVKRSETPGQVDRQVYAWYGREFMG
jgi:hypothetical protein